MTYAKFEKLWTEIVTNHASSRADRLAKPLRNGVSKKLVNALIKAGKGDYSALDAAARKCG